MVTRKMFLSIAGSAAIGLLVPQRQSWAAAGKRSAARKLKFSVISDLHIDLMHDSKRRLQLFIDKMQQEKPDFIIQLGDFCIPAEQNKDAIDLWNSFPENYHVIGNHDTDQGFTHQQVVNFWNMPAAYYSFDKMGYHFVILNGNEKIPGTQTSGYPRRIGKQQLDWLKKDLMENKNPTIVFCHQGLDNTIDGLENGMEVRYLLEQENIRSQFTKVQLVLSGHHHLNYHNEINGIHYVQINSASYYWVGEDYQAQQFDEKFYTENPILRHTLVYEDPIWATVTLQDDKIQLSGRETSFVGIGKENLDIERHQDVYPITSRIDSRVLRL
ncbi:metallophosphoesterase family protein [Sphingobacterium deserti]|uniref:Calcineurin-like phosphoesterase domain-containing protein n=1 Tax=Sphingobacterium deserti TaxID=1229276 RepID=A0A0B8T6D0_9SPHI|nr:metallophosphoesterase [Sphingobacterium deserti]KGE12690.1 hypothetical protein DI53_3429 [Sphingobacterium deserti]